MTYKYDYPYLMGNLVNICESLTSNSKGFIVDCYGSGVYHDKSLAGWTIWLFRDIYWKKKVRGEWVEAALQRVMATFKCHVLHGLELRKNYLKCLEDKLCGQRVSDDAIAQARNALRDCSEATMFFLKLFSKEKHQKLIAPLKDMLPDLEKSFKELSGDVYSSLKRVQQTADIEGILRMAIPIESLKILFSSDNKLSSLEEEKLKMWIEKLNKHKDQISSKSFKVKGFSAALQELVDVIQKVDNDSKITIARLAWKLEKRGCELLMEADSQHVFWRGQLKEDSVITCNKTIFTLGKMLGSKKLYGDIIHVFELKDCSDDSLKICDKVVKIGNNPLRLLIGQLEIDEEQWGVAPAALFETEELGKCQIVQRCEEPTLHLQEWKSTEPKLDSADERRVMAICSHLIWMQMDHAMPYPLDPQKLMFNKEGELTAIKCMKKVSFDYDTVERFCYNVATGTGTHPNPYVLNALIKIAKLDEDSVFKYYRDVVGTALLRGKIELISKPQPMRRESKELDNNVKKICQEAVELRNNCKKAVQEIIRDDGSLLEQVSNRLFELYKVSPTPGTLPPTLLQEVCHSFKKKQRPEFFEYEADAYYNEQYNLLLSYIEQSLKKSEKVNVGEKIEILD